MAVMKWTPEDPWPHDTVEERARRVAMSYRRVIELATEGVITDLPTILSALDEQWVRYQCGWVAPTFAPLRPDDWCTESEIAEMFYISPKTVYMWGYRDQIPVHWINGQRHYHIQQVIMLFANRKKTK